MAPAAVSSSAAPSGPALAGPVLASFPGLPEPVAAGLPELVAAGLPELVAAGPFGPFGSASGVAEASASVGAADTPGDSLGSGAGAAEALGVGVGSGEGAAALVVTRKEGAITGAPSTVTSGA